jgi:sugar transferase EpsL
VRPGYLGKPFNFYKFRTMKNGTGSDSQRITKLGAQLRGLSLDELPQLVNVLKGDISLVGPRPLLMQYLPRYSKRQNRRHLVKPGITGWAQIKGRNALSWEEKFEFDVWYVENRSFWLDLKIIFLTVFAVIQKKGVSQAGHVTMPEFMGSEGPSISN